MWNFQLIHNRRFYILHLDRYFEYVLEKHSLCNDILALFWELSTEISFQNLRPLATEFGDVFAHKKCIFNLH